MLSLKLLGDSQSFDQWTTTNIPCLSYCICTRPLMTKRQYPLALINVGFGVVRALLQAFDDNDKNTSIMVLPSAVILTGSSQVETAELFGFLQLVATEFSKKKYFQKSDEEESSIEINGSSRSLAKLSLVCSSEKIWQSVSKKLQLELEDDLATKMFVRNHVQVTILSTSDEKKTAAGDNSTTLFFKKVSMLISSFQISSMLSVSTTSSNGLLFSLTRSSSDEDEVVTTLPLLSLATSSLFFDAEKLASQKILGEENSTSLFSLIPVPSSSKDNNFFVQKLNDYTEKDGDSQKSRFILVGNNNTRNNSKLTPKSVHLHPTSCKHNLSSNCSEIALLGKIINDTVLEDEKDSVRPSPPARPEKISPKLTATSRRTSLSSSTTAVFSPKSPLNNKGSKKAPSPKKASSVSSPTKEQNKIIKDAASKNIEIENTSLVTPTTALLSVSSASTTINHTNDNSNNQNSSVAAAAALVVPNTPDVSILEQPARLKLKQKEVEEAKQSKEEDESSLTNNDNNNSHRQNQISPRGTEKETETKNDETSNNQEEDTDKLQEVLKEIGESPAPSSTNRGVSNRTIQIDSKATQTPPRRKPRVVVGVDNADDDDVDLDDISPPTRTPKRPKSAEVSRTNITKDKNNNKPSSRASSSSTSFNALVSSSSATSLLLPPKQPSWRQLLEQERSEMIDAPTKLGNACRIFAFSNEDKAQPGQMIMLRTVRTVEQLKQRVSEICNGVRPVGELMFADTGEAVRSMKDLRGVGEEVVATLHGGLPYDLRDPPRLMKCYEELVPDAQWASFCRSL